MVPQSIRIPEGPSEQPATGMPNAFKELRHTAECRCNARCCLREHMPSPGPGMPDLRPITGIKTVPASPFYHRHPLTSSPDRRCRPLPPGVLSGFFLPDRRSAEALPVFRFPEPALRLCPLFARFDRNQTLIWLYRCKRLFQSGNDAQLV